MPTLCNRVVILPQDVSNIVFSAVLNDLLSACIFLPQSRVEMNNIILSSYIIGKKDPASGVQVLTKILAMFVSVFFNLTNLLIQTFCCL